MSRTKSLIAALALVAVSAVQLHAQIGFGAAAGLSAPMGDFGDNVKSGYHVTGLVNIGLPLLPVGGRLEGSFSEYDYKAPGTSSTSKARIIYGTANVVLSTPGILGPYLIGGVGIYRATCTACSISSTKTGFNGGVGFKLGLAGFSAFAEARYHHIPGASGPTNGGVSGSSTQFIPLSVGVSF